MGTLPVTESTHLETNRHSLLEAARVDLKWFARYTGIVCLVLITAAVALWFIEPFQWLILFIAMTQGATMDTTHLPLHPAIAYYSIQSSILLVGFVYYSMGLAGTSGTNGTRSLAMDPRARLRYALLVGGSCILGAFLLVEVVFGVVFRTGILFFEQI